MRQYLSAYSLKALSYIAIIAVFLSACSQNNNTDKNDDKEFAAFSEQQLALLNAGKFKDHRTLIRHTDSFYALKHNVSPYFQHVIYVSKSRDYYEIGEYDSSKMFADSALSIIETNGFEKKYPFDYVNTLTIKGQALYATNHFTQAYNYYFKAEQLSENLKDTCISHEFSYRLAMIAYRQKKYKDAAEYFKRSYISAASCDKAFVYLLQENLDNIALCFENLNMPDSAIYYYDSALSFINKNAHNFPSTLLTEKALAVVCGNIGGIYLNIGNTDTAIALFKKSYSINIQPHYDNRDALLTHLKLANAYLKKKDIALLCASLTDIQKELDSIKHPLEADAQWHNLMYEYNELTGKEATALEHHRTFTYLRDSLWQMEKAQLQNDLSRELKDKEQASEIDLLQKQNQLNNTYLWVTIGFAILALIIIALIYMNYRRGKKNILELKNLNNHINEQKKQLEHTATQLRQTNLDKDRILYVVAHDLRSPISAITMLSTFVLQEKTSDQQKESLEMMQNASQGALSLIAELMEFSTGAKREVSENKETANINELVKQTTDLLQFIAAEKKQKIEISLSSAPLPVSVNKEKIKRVFSNIITNAIKFSPEESGIFVSVTQKAGHAVISVKDNGIGIPVQYQPIVFEPFTSAKRYGTSGEKSFGLGLSICKQIVEANNGRIWFESIEGMGTTFFIELPLEK